MFERRPLACTPAHEETRCQAPPPRVAAKHLYSTLRLGWAACLTLCALAIASCGDTLQDQSIGAAPLETVLVKSHFPVYWLGLRFHGMRITNVTIDPGAAVTIRYGDCVVGGQYTCVTPVSVVSSPDNSFVAGKTATTRTMALRGASASLAQGGATLAIPTGAIVASVYARNPTLAREAAAAIAPLNEVGEPGAPLPAAQPDSGFDRAPLPSEVPPGVSVPRTANQ